MIEFHDLETGGNSVVRVGTYRLHGTGDEAPEIRVMLTNAFSSDRAFPLGSVVSLPLSAVPALRAALERIEELAEGKR